MKIAIFGSGMSGSYLARRLITEGIAESKEITIIDPYYPRNTDCRIAPCAWGLHFGTLKSASRKCNLDWRDYLLERFNRVMIEDITICADLCTFDKSKFISDCLEGIDVLRSPQSASYDIVIDATAWRKIIGSGIEHIEIQTRQMKVDKNKYSESRMRVQRLPFKGYGYLWTFPIGDYVHVGYGAATEVFGLNTYKCVLQDLPSIPFAKDAICSCKGKIRASSPEMSKPIVKQKDDGVVLAVGESAGCISSATGGGNKESIDCVEILIDCWGEWDEYEHKLIEEFKWAHKEYTFIRKLCFGKKPNIFDYWMLKKNAKRYGISLGLIAALKAVKKILYS